jgi:hypothetical protein
MVQRSIAPRSVAPYVVGGATGLYILARMRYLSRQSAKKAPLQIFLLKNTDVLLSLGGASVALWQLAKHRPRRDTAHGTSAQATSGFAASIEDTSLIADVVHHLRQVFTTLLLGLGLIKRRADAGQTQSILGVVQRLKAVVWQGIEAVDELEPVGSADGHTRALGG